jgi:hypothetical protein
MSLDKNLGPTDVIPTRITFHVMFDRVFNMLSCSGRRIFDVR